jgi:lipopolysaccharide export system protein LptA
MPFTNFNLNRSLPMGVSLPAKPLSLLPFLLLLLLLVSPAWSAEKAPINVEADRMVSLEQKNSVLFSGNVLATQADVKIRSKEMTVFYSDAAKGGGQEVKKLQCVGNVEVTKGDWLGTGETMDYLAPERKVILSGKAKAWQGKNQVTGETIVYYLDEGRSEVVPSKASATPGQKAGRVNATIIPK